jgi:plastocyanin
VQAAAQKQKDEDLARARTLEAEMSGHVVAPTAMPDGSMKYHVEVGGMDMQNNLEYHRFTPKTLTVKQGDTVEWSMSMPGFHTVTFGAEPDLFTIEAQQAGPPKLVLNPQVFPSGSTVHTGTGYYNSGPMASPDQPDDPMTVKAYSLKFTQPGRYEYICIPHYSLGMDATIIVEAASAAPDGTTKTAGTSAGMPSTGSPADWLLPASIVSLLLAVSGAALRLRLRRSNRVS